MSDAAVPAPGTPGTDTIIVMLVVPKGWSKLPIPEIARKLLANEPALSNMLASEVKRWAGVDATNLTELQRFIDVRMGKI